MDSLTNSMKTDGRDVSTAVTFTQVTKSAVEAATADITFSDTVTNNMLLTVGDNTFQLTYNDDPTMEEGAIKVSLSKTDDASAIAAKVADAINAVAANTATADGAKVSFASGTAIETIGAGLTLQVGDTNAEFNHVNVKVDDLTAGGLGLDDLDVSSQEAAGDAIDVIKAAINQVSTNRGNLGAIQNRLEYTINNLDTTNENMTAANSRIRDTDMAKEMMNYTKMNILTQAAQAMLAQANQQPQSILQLLQ
ncbi:MAG: hypothetical protein GXY01_09010 [Clostridiales bacterium]|nr:hypothetical protein [Clostridiales bacterium]